MSSVNIHGNTKIIFFTNTMMISTAMSIHNIRDLLHWRLETTKFTELKVLSTLQIFAFISNDKYTEQTMKHLKHIFLFSVPPFTEASQWRPDTQL
jgi:hypothetical protein